MLLSRSDTANLQNFTELSRVRGWSCLCRRIMVGSSSSLSVVESDEELELASVKPLGLKCLAPEADNRSGFKG